jgi:glutaminyl-peptide cyclotransferase
MALLAATACSGPAARSPENPPAASAAPASGQATPARVPVSGYEIVNVYPHDPKAFTQGLVYREGFLYESTGQFGQSTLRKVKLETGEVLERHRLDDRYFAEGLAVWRDQLVQLTWQNGLGFVYDRATFKSVRTFKYTGEGWGLTDDGRALILSDGSPTLKWFDPATFQETGRRRRSGRARPAWSARRARSPA